MNLKTYRDVVDAIVTGQRVVVHCRDEASRRHAQREVLETFPGRFRREERRNLITSSETGGLAHFIIRPEEARGQEYHHILDLVHAEIASRVRLGDGTSQ